MAGLGWRNIKLAIHSGLYGRSLWYMVSDKSRLGISAPAESSITVEHGICSLEVRGQRRGLYERDGTV